MIDLGVCGQPCASMSAFFSKKEVESNEMVNSCSRCACVPAFIWSVLLHCGRGKGGQAPGGIGAERQAGCRRRKRIGNTMRRISQRIVLTVIFGICRNGNAQKSDAIIFCRKKGRIVAAKGMGCVETVKSVLMDGTPPVLVTACRRSLWKCVCTRKHSEERG